MRQRWCEDRLNKQTKKREGVGEINTENKRVCIVTGAGHGSSDRLGTVSRAN